MTGEEAYWAGLGPEDGCSTCGNDLDEDAHGDQCLTCWIEDKRDDCADAELEMSLEE